MKKILLLFLAVFLTGCAASKFGSAGTSYQADDFSTAWFIEDGLAILPVVAGQGVEGFRRPFGVSIDKAVTASVAPDAMRWMQTMDHINDAGLVDEYTNAIRSYRESAILNKNVLKKVAQAAGVRYLLYTALDPPSNTVEKSRSLWNRDATATLETIEVSCFMQVWDTELGDVVWEGTGEAGVKANSDAFQSIKDKDRDLSIHTDRLANELIWALAGNYAGEKK